MNYEKKYKEALSRARQFSEHPLQEDSDSIVEYIFPELKESEDEKIRKGLIKAVSRTFEGNKLFGTDVTREEALAWLERQGEQKVSYTTTVETGDGGINALVTRDIEIPFGAKDSELQEATYFIPKGYYAKVEGDKVVIKKGEQPPVNKVVQKFKVGDFLVSDYCMGKVVEITNDAYLLDTGQGIPFSCGIGWSEEDNKWIENLIQTFEDGYFEGFNQLKSYGVIDWLKSIKQRIGG